MNNDDLVAQMEALDIDGLMAADPARLEAMRGAYVLKQVKHGHNLLVTALFWGYFQRNAAKKGEAFELPQVVRDNLTRKVPSTWKPGQESDGNV